MGATVAGTVSQRAFIGRQRSSIVNVASVSLKDLAIHGDDDTRGIVAQLLGVPRETVVDQNAYDYVLQQLPGPEMLVAPHWPVSFDSEVLAGPTSPVRFFEDFMAILTTPAPLPPTVYYGYSTEGIYEVTDINAEGVYISLQCAATRLFRDSDIDAFTKEILLHDIPLGQSPKIKSDSLLRLLETSRHFCIAPLVFGVKDAVSQLNSGDYVGALCTTATAGAMTLILIGTVSVGTLMVHRVAQLRSRENSQEDSR